MIDWLIALLYRPAVKGNYSLALFTRNLDDSITYTHIYADEQMTTPHPNPVVADSDGNFPDIYLAEKSYCGEIRDSLYDYKVIHNFTIIRGEIV